jgi:hypothetical protein
MRFFRGNTEFCDFGESWDSCKTAIKNVGVVKPGAIVYPFQETMSSPTNEIKARAKLPSMPFPYLVTLLILLSFVLFRKHSGLVGHNLCGTRRRVKWHVQKCAGRWAFLHRKSRLRHSLIPKFFVRGGTPSRSPRSGLQPRFGLRPQWISLQLIFHDLMSGKFMKRIFPVRNYCGTITNVNFLVNFCAPPWHKSVSVLKKS